jgi:hypothetical protein
MEPKPRYIHHRNLVGAPVAADHVNIGPGSPGLIADNKLRGEAGDETIRGSVPTAGFKTIDGVVKLTGGAAPTVTLQPLEVIKYKNNGTGEEVDEFVSQGANIGPLSHNDRFSITVNDAMLFLRLHAVTGAPTGVELLIAGGEAQAG